jgi:hypothetical protein
MVGRPSRTKRILSRYYEQRNKIDKDIIPMFHINHSINIEQFNIELKSIILYNSFNIPTSNLTKLNSLTLHFNTFEHKLKKIFLNDIEIYCLNLKKLKMSHFDILPKFHVVIIGKFCIKIIL